MRIAFAAALIAVGTFLAGCMPSTDLEKDTDHKPFVSFVTSQTPSRLKDCITRNNPGDTAWRISENNGTFRVSYAPNFNSKAPFWLIVLNAGEKNSSVQVFFSPAMFSGDRGVRRIYNDEDIGPKHFLAPCVDHVPDLPLPTRTMTNNATAR